MLKKLNISKKGMEFALFFGLLCAIFWSAADFDASCEQLRKNVVRLHIVANSDSQEDQALKLEIRDRILKTSENLFENVTDKENAIESAKSSLSDFEKIANEVIKEKGFSYTAKAEIGKAYFETREYDEFTLPAGNYESLIIKLGKAEGKTGCA